MRDASGHSLPGDNRGLWQQQVQLARGHWRREDAAGAIRTAGWGSVIARGRRPRAGSPSCCAAAGAGGGRRHDCSGACRCRGHERQARAAAPAPPACSRVPPAPGWSLLPGNFPAQAGRREGRIREMPDLTVCPGDLPGPRPTARAISGGAGSADDEPLWFGERSRSLRSRSVTSGPIVIGSNNFRSPIIYCYGCAVCARATYADHPILRVTVVGSRFEAESETNWQQAVGDPFVVAVLEIGEDVRWRRYARIPISGPRPSAGRFPDADAVAVVAGKSGRAALRGAR